MLNELNLQLFSEGAGEGGEGGNSGETALPAAGDSRLLELGVPASKIRKRANKAEVQPQAQAEVQAEVQEAVEQTPTADVAPDEGAKKPTWDELMKDPEYNKHMQSVVQSRLKSAKAAEDTISKLGPALELLASRYGLDAENLDFDELTSAINSDSTYYEDKALELGVPVETAMKIDQSERETARRQREEERSLEEQAINNHIAKLHKQGETLKKAFPNFDLAEELRNPAFARMTAPNVGISVEDAYYAVHRNEIQTAAMQVTAQKTAERISNSIQAGKGRPTEHGISSQAPSVVTFDYAKASREQREALKRRIRDAEARGEKIYPGR